MRVDANDGSGPNYWPNSFGGPAPDPGFLEPPFEVSGLATHTTNTHPNDDFVQPGNLYRDVMTVQDRENLVGNIASHLSEPRNGYSSGKPPCFSKLIQTIEAM
jgi:catalase